MIFPIIILLSRVLYLRADGGGFSSLNDIIPFVESSYNLKKGAKLSDALDAMTSVDGGSFMTSRVRSDERLQSLAVPSATTTFTGIQTQVGLSSNCSNSLCLMMEYALTCKAIGLGMKKICAQYFLGAYLGCSMFPPPSAIYNAPSTCLTEYTTILTELSQTDTTTKSGGLFDIVGAYLNPSTFQTNSCGRRCYQNYQIASNQYYLSCYGKSDVDYPVEETLFQFQEFRNQACTYTIKNGEQKNCYAQLSTLSSGSTTSNSPTYSPASGTPSVSPTQSPTGSTRTPSYSPTITPTEFTATPSYAPTSLSPSRLPTNAPSYSLSVTTSAISDFNCTYSLYLTGGTYSQQYGAYNSNIYKLNAAFSKQLCTDFSSLQCCAANDVTMLEQNIGQILPPCLYNYFNTNCTAVNFQGYCGAGAIANMTTLSATITINKLTTACPVPKLAYQSFPDMYNKVSVLTLQGVVTTALLQTTYLRLEPYNFNASKPLQVQVMGYSYQSTKGAVTTTLTPKNGSTYWPPQGDYKSATSGQFKIQVVAQNLSPAQAANLTKAITSPAFTNIVNFAYCNVVTKTKTVVNKPAFTIAAEPLSLSSASLNGLYSKSIVLIFTPIVLLSLYFVHF